jgi:hypothetical protein
MKTLEELGRDLAVFCDGADLRRVREMSEADFAMLLALHSAEVSYIEAEARKIEGGAA